MSQLKLFLVVLGCTPPGRHTEQHDIFLGIANSIEELFPAIKAFWPEGRVHIDAWREVTKVENSHIVIIPKTAGDKPDQNLNKLFLLNLGGYQENKFEEQHYVVLTIKPGKPAAIKEAKSTLFYQHNQFAGATSHIDDKYGVDVDDIYEIEELLTSAQKEKYRIDMVPAENLPDDAYHLGYLKLPESL